MFYGVPYKSTQPCVSVVNHLGRLPTAHASWGPTSLLHVGSPPYGQTGGRPRRPSHRDVCTNEPLVHTSHVGKVQVYGDWAGKWEDRRKGSPDRSSGTSVEGTPQFYFVRYTPFRNPSCKSRNDLFTRRPPRHSVF